jgi:hypothetical protein
MMIKTKIYTYWKSRLLEEAKLYKSLKFMDKHLMFGKVHQPIDDFFALVMLPYSAIALICISASIGRVPARMKTAGSATLIYSN